MFQRVFGGNRWFLSFVLVLLAGCAVPADFRYPVVEGGQSVDLTGKAVVVLASDIRERTSLRPDLKHFGQVYFVRIDDSYLARGESSYDFGIEYSLASDWAALASEDENRLAKVFVIDPGTYVLEKVSIGSSPTTIGRGFNPQTGLVRYGGFQVQAGEVVDLGRLLVHMHFYSGYFSARVEENTTDAQRALGQVFPDLVTSMVSRPLEVAATMPFH